MLLDGKGLAETTLITNNINKFVGNQGMHEANKVISTYIIDNLCNDIFIGK